MANCKRIAAQTMRKLLVVGDGMTGKTSLLCAFKGDDFDSTRSVTLFDTHVAEVEMDGKSFHLALYDTGGGEEYHRLRPLSYPDTDVFLICFSVDIPSSASSSIDKLNSEIRYFCNECPIILVACKIDLRADSSTFEKMKERGETLVTSETGRQIAVKLKADAYMECSSKTREGIQDLFNHAVRLAINHRTRSHRRRCCVLC